MRDLLILAVLVIVLCYGIYIVWTRSSTTCGATVATLFVIIATLFSIDIYLEFRTHVILVDKEDRFQRALCGDTYHLAEFERQASACKDSRLVGDTSFLFRVHKRILSHIGDVYEHVISRWATTTYLQLALPLLVLVSLQIITTFLANRERVRQEANTQKHQMELHAEASRQQSAVISQFTQTLTHIQSQRSMAARGYTEDDSRPKIEEVL